MIGHAGSFRVKEICFRNAFQLWHLGSVCTYSDYFLHKRMLSPPPNQPAQNYLLAALPPAEFERLQPNLELIHLPLGDVLCESGGRLSYVYFPTSAIIPALHSRNGASAEIAGVGHEGVVGVSLFMGGDTTPSSAVVQTAGHAYRLNGPHIDAGIQRAGLLQRLLLRYTQALITQICQTAVCTGTIPSSSSLPLAAGDARPRAFGRARHDAGARRKHARRAPRGNYRGGRQAAACRLIRYRRGHISVLERSGLETRACECYQMVRRNLTACVRTCAGVEEAVPESLYRAVGARHGRSYPQTTRLDGKQSNSPGRIPLSFRCAG